MIILQRRAGESLLIGDEVTVRVLQCRHNSVRLSIDSPPNMSVRRHPLIEPSHNPHVPEVPRASDPPSTPEVTSTLPEEQSNCSQHNGSREEPLGALFWSCVALVGLLQAIPLAIKLFLIAGNLVTWAWTHMWLGVGGWTVASVVLGTVLLTIRQPGHAATDLRSILRSTPWLLRPLVAVLLGPFLAVVGVTSLVATTCRRISRRRAVSEEASRIVSGLSDLDDEIDQLDAHIQRMMAHLSQPQEGVRLSEAQVREHIFEVTQRRGQVLSDFTQLLNQLAEHRVLAARVELDANVQGLQEAQRKVAESRAELARAQRIASFEAEASRDAPAILERLLGHPHIRAVDVVVDKLVIHPDTLFICHRKRRYEIGDFTLTIDPVWGKVRTECLRSTNPARDHPYGYGFGVCFGDADAQLTRFVLQGDYNAAVDLALEMMTRPGPNMSGWKEVPGGR